VVGADATNHYQHIAMEKSRLHIPMLFGQDVIHGHRTTFPVPLAIAATWDPAAAETVARYGAKEARADGVAWVFSPMVDIARDPRWGRIIESNGEDPYLGSALARAWVKGYQQDDLAKPDSAAVSVKHFAAYGAAIAGRDYNAADMSDITLRQVYLPPYHAAVEAGAATVMSSFNSLNGVPATANPYTLTEILRKEWGFDGFVVSDWGAVAELKNHSIGDGPTVARKALEAGVDMDMEGNLYGEVSPRRYAPARFPRASSMKPSAAFCASSSRSACSSIPTRPRVRLTTPRPSAAPRPAKWPARPSCCFKNDAVEGVGALLPLTAKAKKIALIGPLADNQREMLGAWAVTGDPKYAVTLKSALRKGWATGCSMRRAASCSAAKTPTSSGA
jgi:beta-glucosidase